MILPSGVDVVIPTLGRVELRRAVLSVLKQTSLAHPIVVLDRPENLLAVERDLCGLEYELHLTLGAQGGASARNTGLDYCNRSYIAYLDDDDWWDERKLERQFESLEAARTRGPFLMTSSTKFISVSGASRDIPVVSYDNKMPLADYLFDRSQLRYGRYFMQTSSLLGPHDLLSAFRWDEKLPKHQDWDLILRLARDGGAEFLNTREPLVYVSQGTSESISIGANWEASMQFYTKHRFALSQKAKGDFLAALVLRSSLRQRDLRGVRRAVRELWGTKPHCAATLVGLSGMLSRNAVRR